jgi:hypothetical protein
VLGQDFKEFIQSLNAREVRYLVIGGFAVAVHGHPRYTKDLDVWVEQTEENADRMIAALDDFGFSSLGLTREDFLRDHVIQLGYPPNRIDILTFANGLEFESSYAEHITIIIEDTPVNFVGLDQLRQNKKSTGRHQDLADLEALED